MCSDALKCRALKLHILHVRGMRERVMLILSACQQLSLTTVGCQTWTRSPSLPLARMLHCRWVSGLSFINIKNWTRQQAASTAVAESSLWVSRRTLPAVSVEIKGYERLWELGTAKDWGRCRNNLCFDLWSVNKMIQLPNSQRNQLSLKTHFKKMQWNWKYPHKSRGICCQGFSQVPVNVQ